MVVTAAAPSSPLHWVTDPRLPRQPVPASDGADYLKTVPGFSAIRNGGTNGDPVLRGMFGSRLNILTNGGVMLGACPNRMDAPTSYISPETYDRLTVIKGPQTVLWGPGASAATILFERDTPRFNELGGRVDGSLLAGSNGRFDRRLDATAGGSQGYLRLLANRAMVYVGTISYSLYLVHWPVIVFYRDLNGPLDLPGMGAELLQRFPELRARLARRSQRLPRALDWALADDVRTLNRIKLAMAEGKPLPGPRLSYGSDFSAESGFAVVRTAAQGPSACATWGLLHPDGRFVPAPAHLLEPLTNGDGWLVGNTPDTPLVPFLTRDGQLAYIDGEGVVVWRAHYDGQQVALLGAEGAPLWRSGVRENCWPPRPFFHAPLTDHLEGLDTLDGIVPLASRLLAQAETRLHQLAAGDMLQADRAGTEKDDDGTDEEEDADDPDQVQADRTVVVRRVMRAYLSESHNGPYEFLSADLHRAVNEAREAMVQRLSARFGPADPDPEHAAPWHRSGDHTQAWASPLAGRWSLDVSRIPAEERPQSVTIEFAVSSDGKWTTHVEIVDQDGTTRYADSTAELDGVPVPPL